MIDRAKKLASCTNLEPTLIASALVCRAIQVLRLSTVRSIRHFEMAPQLRKALNPTGMMEYHDQ